CLRVLRRPPAGSPSVRRSSRPGGRAPRNPHAPVPLSRLRARFEHLPLGTCSRARWLHGCPRPRLAARRGTWVAWLPLAGVGCMAAPVLALRLVGARGLHGFPWLGLVAWLPPCSPCGSSGHAGFTATSAGVCCVPEAQGAAGGGTGTGMTVTSDSSPRKSAGLG